LKAKGNWVLVDRSLNFAERTLKRTWRLQCSPWAGLGYSRPKSGEGTSRRRGERVGLLEEVEGNLLVCSVGAGVAGVGLPAVSRSSTEVWAMGGGSQAR
jgi:hypothetical protein